SKTSYNAKPGAILRDAPMVILVNGGSASAAEIVAGALQEHKRALIMGSPTYGKGSVQTIFPIANGAAVKLTTAHYFTPSGRSIQGVGIKPDIASAQLEEKTPQQHTKDQQLREALKILKRLSVQKTSSRTRH
ncbi:MAG: peptidase S41, partial [Gammaproteobacteria bacterium]|nr:peptidase S41 [Gammaproteobacteria bacterium]